jgi:hypothetical protein
MTDFELPSLEGFPAPWRVIAGLISGGNQIGFLVIDADNFDVAKTPSEHLARAIASIPDMMREIKRLRNVAEGK